MAIARTGLCCMLNSRKILERMQAPWFAEKPETLELGEDWFFCDRARGAGFTVHIDAQLEVGHLATAQVQAALRHANPAMTRRYEMQVAKRDVGRLVGKALERKKVG